MDPSEDLSARVLLKHILTTETPRTPITSSTSKTQSTTGTRRSARLSKKDAGGQTPQDILRRSLKHKLRESISRKSPPPKRRTTVFRNTPQLVTTSQLFDEGDTPRQILMNILRTEPVRSPVVHEKAAPEEPQPPSANSSITNKYLSIELTDITIGNLASTARGLSRKRPRRSLNVTAFEKQLQDGDDVEDEESVGDHSSLSLSSSTSLSLKTPFVDVQTERRGLQRKVFNTRKITEEEFDAAVNKRHMEGVGSVALAERDLSETTHSEGFTLGLTKLSEPDLTTDIINYNTALYAQTDDVMTSSFSIVAMQDKPTVMASQLQREMEQEEQLEMEQSHPEREKSAEKTEEGAAAEPQDEDCVSLSQSEKEAGKAQNEEEKHTADFQPEDAVAMSESEDVAESQISGRDDAAESEEEENRVESQTAEEGAAECQTEEDVAAGSQSEEEEDAEECQSDQQDPAGNSQSEEEDVAADSQTAEDVAAESQSEEDEDAEECQSDQQDPAGNSQSEEEDVAADSQTAEDVAAESQSEEDEDAEECQSDQQDPAGNSQSEEEDVVADSETEGDVAAESQSEEDEDAEECQSDQQDPAGNSQSEEEDFVADSETEDKHDGKQEAEHVSPGARRSEGGLILPVTEAEGNLPEATMAGCSEPSQGSEDEAETSTQRHGLNDVSSTEEELEADDENFPPLELMCDDEDSGNLSDASPEEAEALDPVEQEEEEDEGEDDEDEDEEESEEVPMKTPAFVKEKRNFFRSDPLASPTAFKNIQGSDEGLPPVKKKPVRQRKTGAAKRETGLPKSYLMAVFKHFAKTKVSADVYPVLKQIMDKFFDRMADDLETYAVHAKRKTIEVEDAELLLKRQGYVNDKVPVEVLIEKYLRMDQRKLLIPIATSGNVVVPKKRR